MVWRECTALSERREFAALAAERSGPLAVLARTYGISRSTAYKWRKRFEAEGWSGLSERSRKPHHSPRRTTAAVEELVCSMRRDFPWGGRTIHHRLRQDGHPHVPAPSTITDILKRNGLLAPQRRLKRDHQRFEEEEPNGLWQMDFKGHFPTGQGRCHPLTVIDDHSRFNVCLAACANERRETVQQHLEFAFQRYGLPQRMLTDNGPPWGSGYSAQPYTRLGAWLIRLGITVSHGRPRHPQTQGKEERFHRTLKVELLAPHGEWLDLAEVQQSFDRWRDVYNLYRPHQALAYSSPASRYRPSGRSFPAKLPPVEYDGLCQLRKVGDKGEIYFRGKVYVVSKAFVGETVALRAADESVWHVYYCHQRVGKVDLSAPGQPDL